MDDKQSISEFLENWELPKPKEVHIKNRTTAIPDGDLTGEVHIPDNWREIFKDKSTEDEGVEEIIS